jgi:hypothetical protein
MHQGAAARNVVLDQSEAQRGQIRDGGLYLVTSDHWSDAGRCSGENEITRLQAEKARQM